MAHLNPSNVPRITFHPSLGITSTLAVPLSLAAATLFLFLVYGRGSQADNIPSLGGFPLLTAWRFFSKRHDFMLEGFARTGQRLFQFYILQVRVLVLDASSLLMQRQHRVIAVSGDEGRKLFFNNANLDLDLGYQVLYGSAPMLGDIGIDGPPPESVFLKRLHPLLKKERIADGTPFS